jgi:hypothetical protein
VNDHADLAGDIDIESLDRESGGDGSTGKPRYLGLSEPFCPLIAGLRGFY